MAGESKAWAEQLREMLEHLRMAERGCLLIVAVEDGELESEIAAALKENLDGQVEVSEHTLSPTYPSLGAYLRALGPPTGRTATLVHGLEDLPEEARERAFRYLNTEREVLRLAERSVVLFTSPEALSRLLHRSPDFCAWSSGIFEFRAPADEVERDRELAALHLLLAGSDLEKLRRRYLEYLVNEHEWLDFRGLMQVRNIVRFRLDDIYVPLQATTQPSPPSPLPPYAPLPLSQAWERGRGEGGVEVRALPLPERKVKLSEALSENDRLVVLGDPGSGKTTLLKYLALSLAQVKGERVGLPDGLLPILLPLSAYAEALSRGADMLAEFLPRYFAQRGLPDLSALFASELKRGHCLVLLDGLDEVVGVEDREEIARRVRQFVADYPRNRYMVTSRIAGYRPGLLSDHFAHFTILPFDDEEIEKFARQWCCAYEMMGRAELTPEAERRVEERAENLIAAITSRPAIKRLAADPLLVTILALIHYQGTRLPHRRVELYRLCVEALAETWNLARSLTGRPIDLWLGERRLDERFMVQLLAPIAFWMHSQRPGGLVGREELEERLATYFEEREGKSSEEAGKLAHDFVELIREQSGLLVERGPDQFGFMHLTFEECLAARYLAGRRNVNELVKEHLHDPRWREVILLTAGTLRGDFVDDLVEAIWKANSPYDDLLHRDLLLAARCLADDVSVAYVLRRRILDELFVLWRTTRYEKLQEETTDALAAMRGSVAAPQAVEGLLVALQDEDSRVRGRAAWALGHFGSAEVMESLLVTLQDEDSRVRGSAALALGRLGSAPVEVAESLLAALQDEDSGVRESVAAALGQLGSVSAEVVEGLLAALQDEDDWVRSGVAVALGQLRQATDEVVEGLLTALWDESDYVRGRAAWALGQLGQTTDAVVESLLTTLRGENWQVRRSAAEALGQLGQVTDEVVEGLLATLRDVSWSVRESAATALGQLGQTTDEVVEDLLVTLRDEGSWARWRAALALGQLGQATDEIVESLLAALWDEDGWVQWRVVLALEQLGQTTDEVVESLLAALQDEDDWMRGRAAGALGQLGQTTDQVVNALLRGLKDESAKVRAIAASALSQLKADGQVAQELVGMLGDRRNEEYAWTPSRHAPAYDFIFEALWEMVAAEEQRRGG